MQEPQLSSSEKFDIYSKSIEMWYITDITLKKEKRNQEERWGYVMVFSYALFDMVSCDTCKAIRYSFQTHTVSVVGRKWIMSS